MVIRILVLLSLIIFAVFILFPKTSKPKTSTIFWRFQTAYGGEFDLTYPNTYFASQDYHTKVITFKKTGCEINCDTLFLSLSDRNQHTGELITLGSHEYLIIQDQTFVELTPQWTDKLGLIRITSSKDKAAITDDFKGIISSIAYVRDIPASGAPQDIQVSPSPTPTTPTFVKRLTKWQTGPHDFLTFPDEIASIPDSEVIGLSCETFTQSGGIDGKDHTSYFGDKYTNKLTDTRILAITTTVPPQGYSMGGFTLCQTEKNQYLVLYTADKDTPTYQSEPYTALLDSNFNLLTQVKWNYQPTSLCFYPILYKEKDNMFGSEKILYSKCLHDNVIVRVDINAKTTSVLYAR